MSPRDLFGVIVRAAGIFFWVYCAFDIGHVFLKLLGDDPGSHYTLIQDAFAAAFFFVLGTAAVFGAELIVRSAYKSG